MEKFLEKLGKNKFEIILAVLIIAFGIFLRTYHFSDWLHFEVDQTFDFNLVSPAVAHGIANLPLLGPNAGSQSLRLGPAFYYLEYLAAKIFGNTPQGHAGGVLSLAILALPLFYIFIRRYFSKQTSLGLLALYATSLYLILYSRFSWSPNVLPFLGIALAYALLRAVSKNEKRKNVWFLIAVALATFTSQIHFNAFFTVPVIFILFLIIKRPRFSWPAWIGAVLIVLMMYLPVVLNEIKTHGQDLAFFGKEMTRVHRGQGGSLITSTINDIEYHASEFSLILTGQDVINNAVEHGSGTDLVPLCRPGVSCKESVAVKIFGLLVIILGTYFAIRNFRKEDEDDRRNFLLLILLWFYVFFAYMFALIHSDYSIEPRFFLFVSPLAIIFLGLALDFLAPEKDKWRLIIFSLVIIVLAALNLQKVRADFDQLKNAGHSDQDVETEDVFPDNSRLTYYQETAIANYIYSKYEKNHYPVYLQVTHKYYEALWYQLKLKGVPYFDKGQGESPFVVYAEGNYFIIADPTKNDPFAAKRDYRFSTVGSQDFGSLIVYYLQPKSQFVNKLIQKHQGKSLQARQISKLMTWKKLFEN